MTFNSLNTLTLFLFESVLASRATRRASRSSQDPWSPVMVPLSRGTGEPLYSLKLQMRWGGYCCHYRFKDLTTTALKTEPIESHIELLLSSKETYPQEAIRGLCSQPPALLSLGVV